MRTNAIVRIILFSLAILVLGGILIAALSVDLFMVRGGSISNSSTTLPMACDGYTNTCVADSSEIQNIEIEWAAGTIQIVPDETATNITVAETNNGNEKYNMVCQTLGNKLEVRFCKDSIEFPSFGFNANVSKDLVIFVPETWECDTLEVDAASANLNVSDMTIRNVDFDGASGICVFENCHVDTLDLDTASGDIDFTGTLNVLECDAVSANFLGVMHKTPSRMTFDGVSGDFDITLPSDCGFTVTLDSVSGEFESQFPTTVSGGSHICGDGHCRIETNGVSGSVIIRDGNFVNAEMDVAADSASCTDSDCTDTSHHHSENHH